MEHSSINIVAEEKCGHKHKQRLVEKPGYITRLSCQKSHHDCRHLNVSFRGVKRSQHKTPCYITTAASRKNVLDQSRAKNRWTAAKCCRFCCGNVLFFFAFPSHRCYFPSLYESLCNKVIHVYLQVSLDVISYLQHVLRLNGFDLLPQERQGQDGRLYGQRESRK